MLSKTNVKLDVDAFFKKLRNATAVRFHEQGCFFLEILTTQEAKLLVKHFGEDSHFPQVQLRTQAPEIPKGKKKNTSGVEVLKWDYAMDKCYSKDRNTVEESHSTEGKSSNVPKEAGASQLSTSRKLE